MCCARTFSSLAAGSRCVRRAGTFSSSCYTVSCSFCFPCLGSAFPSVPQPLRQRSRTAGAGLREVTRCGSRPSRAQRSVVFASSQSRAVVPGLCYRTQSSLRDGCLPPCVLVRRKPRPSFPSLCVGPWWTSRTHGFPAGTPRMKRLCRTCSQGGTHLRVLPHADVRYLPSRPFVGVSVVPAAVNTHPGVSCAHVTFLLGAQPGPVVRGHAECCAAACGTTNRLQTPAPCPCPPAVREVAPCPLLG